MMMIGTVAFVSDDEQVIHLTEAALPGLAGIEGYSHLIVLTRAVLDPRFAPDDHGVFSVRNGARPSGINVWIVEVLGRDDELLKMRRLRAPLGSEVIDLMPYEQRDAIPLAVEPK